MRRLVTPALPYVLAVLAVVAVACTPSHAHAQTTSQLALLDDWEHQRRHILAVIDSATPAMLEFRPTPGVRTFAEQVHHIVSVAALIVGNAVARTAIPATLAGDSARFLHDRVELRAMAARHLDFVVASLGTVSDTQFAEEQRFAGGAMSRWRWNVTALQHSAWTLGQLVPYLRLNGRTPPQFTPF